MSARRAGNQVQEAAEAGWRTVREHPLLGSCGGHFDRVDRGNLDETAWVLVVPDGWIQYRQQRVAEPAEWTWMFAHAVLHLGLGHTDPCRAEPADIGAEAGARRGTARLPGRAYAAVCCITVDRLLRTLKVGRCPYRMATELPLDQERDVVRLWHTQGVPDWAEPIPAIDFLIGDEQTARRLDFPGEFVRGLTASATGALGLARGARVPGRGLAPWDRALEWFVSSFPLLGAVAAGMTVDANGELARHLRIGVAAVNAGTFTVLVNPNTRLTAGEWRFVIGHELLHAALRHDARAGGREPYTWNIACDYVVNGWLVEMGVGEIPEGALYDPALAGWSCEGVYDRIAGELRRLRRLATLRGRGLPDMLDGFAGDGRSNPRHVDLDEYYRNALSMGLASRGHGARGIAAAGLEEAIWALAQPPLAWDAALAEWFEEHVPIAEKRRSYARPSRRQTTTPGIPRPGWIRPEEVARQHTFGVVLDTSGSMGQTVLGKALGAVAAHAVARGVARVRVIFCDAAAHDAGYLSAADIADRVVVRGRGGTVLQPGIDFLEAADDFPPDGPILVITDGKCDIFRVHREHAILIPVGAELPFHARGTVLRIS